VTELTFLGTGNFLAPPGRYWNSFVMDTSVLVEPSPTALPHLRRCGFAVGDIEVVVVSHFHADHCFGWPFFLQAAAELGGGRTLHVVGPPGIEEQLAMIMDAGAVGGVLATARQRLDLRFTEVDGSWQGVGPLRFRAIEVVHVPYLRCFGYLFERPGVFALAGYALAILRGRHLERPDVHHRRAKGFRLSSAGVVPLQTDGDPAGELPATVEVLPQKLRLLVPSTEY